MNRNQKIIRRAEILRSVIDHPNTGDGERTAAEHALHRLLSNNPGARQLAEAETATLLPVVTGDRYDPALDITTIAATLRKEFQLRRRTARKAGGADIAVIDPIGDLPAEVKISVRAERGSVYDIIRVNLKGAPDHWWIPGWPYDTPGPTLSHVGQEISDAVQSFNRNGSDLRFDHVDVRFHSQITADHRTI